MTWFEKELRDMSANMAVRVVTPEGSPSNADGWHEFLEVIGSIAFMRFGDVFFTQFYWEPQVSTVAILDKLDLQYARLENVVFDSVLLSCLLVTRLLNKSQ